MTRRYRSHPEGRPQNCAAATVALVLAAAALRPQTPPAPLPSALRELRAAVAAVPDGDDGRACALAAVSQLVPGAEAVRALDAADAAAIVRALGDAHAALERALEPDVERRLQILRGDGGSMRLGRLRHRVQRGHDVQAAILQALRRLPAAAGPALLAELVRGQGAPLQLRLCLCDLLPATAESAAAWLDGELGTGAADALVVLLRAAAALGPRAGGAARWVVQLLAHPSGDVRALAIAACEQLRQPQVLEPLIARLAVEAPLLRPRIVAALQALTGQHPGDAAASWQAWLQAEGAPYLDGRTPLGRGRPAPAAPPRGRAAAAGDAGATAVGYFGIPQDGAVMLYVVDRSQSMGQPAPGRTRAGGGPPPGGADRADDPDSRWQYCLAELRRGFGQLRPEQRFQVVAFANRVRTWADKPQLATAANTERALAWLIDLGLEFETNTYDALEWSFALAGRGARDRYYPCEIDTIYFLSDGEPTRPDEQGRLPRGPAYDDPAQILAAVQRWNPLGAVRVHAIGIGLRSAGRRRGRGGGGAPVDARAFLRDLAAQNGGTFVDRR